MSRWRSCRSTLRPDSESAIRALKRWRAALELKTWTLSQVWASRRRADRRNTAEPEESVTVSQLWASRRRADRRNMAEPEESVTVSQHWASRRRADRRNRRNP